MAHPRQLTKESPRDFSLIPAVLLCARDHSPEGRGSLGCRDGSSGRVPAAGDTRAGAEKCLHLEHPPPASPLPMALERSQLSLGTSPADPSGSKCEKSSFQTQLDIPRWQVSTNISICMRHFNQARSNKSRTINIRSCSPVVMTGNSLRNWKLPKREKCVERWGRGGGKTWGAGNDFSRLRPRSNV